MSTIRRRSLCPRCKHRASKSIGSIILVQSYRADRELLKHCVLRRRVLAAGLHFLEMEYEVGVVDFLWHLVLWSFVVRADKDPNESG